MNMHMEIETETNLLAGPGRGYVYVVQIQQPPSLSKTGIVMAIPAAPMVPAQSWGTFTTPSPQGQTYFT